MHLQGPFNPNHILPTFQADFAYDVPENVIIGPCVPETIDIDSDTYSTRPLPTTVKTAKKASSLVPIPAPEHTSTEQKDDGKIVDKAIHPDTYTLPSLSREWDTEVEKLKKRIGDQKGKGKNANKGKATQKEAIKSLNARNVWRSFSIHAAQEREAAKKAARPKDNGNRHGIIGSKCW